MLHALPLAGASPGSGRRLAMPNSAPPLRRASVFSALDDPHSCPLRCSCGKKTPAVPSRLGPVCDTLCLARRCLLDACAPQASRVAVRCPCPISCAAAGRSTSPLSPIICPGHYARLQPCPASPATDNVCRPPAARQLFLSPSPSPPAAHRLLNACDATRRAAARVPRPRPCPQSCNPRRCPWCYVRRPSLQQAFAPASHTAASLLYPSAAPRPGSPLLSLPRHHAPVLARPPAIPRPRRRAPSAAATVHGCPPADLQPSYRWLPGCIALRSAQLVALHHAT